MPFNPDIHRRRSVRLKGYDYSQPGSYFVTVCTHERECLFGEIVDGDMVLNVVGLLAKEIWERLPDHYPHVRLDAFVIMPNHVHGIIALAGTSVVGAGLKPAPTGRTDHGLPEIVRAFKTFSSRRINEFRRTRGVPVWQRNYYEHVIRNERTLNAIREYIEANPSQWDNDQDNPDVIRLAPPT